MPEDTTTSLHFKLVPLNPVSNTMVDKSETGSTSPSLLSLQQEQPNLLSRAPCLPTFVSNVFSTASWRNMVGMKAPN